MTDKIKLYSREGDTGRTSLSGGRHVMKNSFRIHAFGTIEELNSYFGIVLSQLKDKRLADFIHTVQRDLISIGGHLAGAQIDFSMLPTHVTDMEYLIDSLAEQMPPQDKFTLPEGTERAAYFYLARAVTRRAERELVALSEEEPIDDRILAFFNRLSDLFFVMAKYVNFKAGVVEASFIEEPKIG
jgi:cob(I)alamin adenosyltransferase